MIKIKLIYRNYKPLHRAYASLIENPPKGIKYVVPPTNTKVQGLYRAYTMFRFAIIAKPLIHFFEKHIFLKDKQTEGMDVFQYLNIIDESPPSKPYIVDTEHAAGLISYVPDQQRINKARDFLVNPNCGAITCWSNAAMKTLEKLLGKEYKHILRKVHVVYPALESVSKLHPDYQYINDQQPGLKLLFVGNQAYRKGFEELLEAIRRVNDKCGADKLELHVVSNDAGKIIRKYGLRNVTIYPPKYDKIDIIKKFYMPADVLIMPTKQDTFGLALLDAMACGTAVITTRQFAAPEIITDGKDGILLKIDKPILDTYLVPNKAAMDKITKSNRDEKLVRQIVQVLSAIIDGGVDIRAMGERGRKKFVNHQKFSIARRNSQLLEIYSSLSDKC